MPEPLPLLRRPREITLRDVVQDELVRLHFHGQSESDLFRLANWISREPEKWHVIELYQCPCRRPHAGICDDRRWVRHRIGPHEVRAMAGLLRVLAWRLRSVRGLSAI